MYSFAAAPAVFVPVFLVALSGRFPVAYKHKASASISLLIALVWLS